VLTALLGPRTFGVMALALVVLMVSQTLLQQVLVTTLIQREDLADDHLQAGFWLVLLGSLGIAVLVVGGSRLWAAYNHLPELASVCVALAPVIVLQGLTVVPDAILRRRLAFRSLAGCHLVAAATGGVLGIWLAFSGAGVWALVAQQQATALVSVVLLWTITDWRPRLRLPRQGIRDLSGFSGHTALASLGVMLALRADLLVLGAFFSPVVVGLYRLANRLPDMALEATVRSVQQVSLPELARVQREPDLLADRLRKLVHAATTLGFPAMGILAGCAGALVSLLGDDWVAAADPMRLLCLVAALNVVGVMLVPVLQAVGRPGVVSLFAWLHGLAALTGFAVVGSALRSAAEGRQVSAVALTALTIDVVLTVALAVVAFRWILRIPAGRVLAPAVPALVAGLAAFGVGLAIERVWQPAGPAALVLFVSGLFTALAAVAVLLVGDGELRHLLLKVVNRVGPIHIQPTYRGDHRRQY
jgi:PST family polysaccharide transporter